MLSPRSKIRSKQLQIFLSRQGVHIFTHVFATQLPLICEIEIHPANSTNIVTIVFFRGGVRGGGGSCRFFHSPPPQVPLAPTDFDVK